MHPTVSVVVPYYNYQGLIGHCVSSIQRQQYMGKIEIIVVDDCSPVPAEPILASMEKTWPVKVIRHNVNKGYSAAKNTGIEASSGHFISMLDADDMLTPNSINQRAWYLESHPNLLMVHGLAYTITGDMGHDYYDRRRSKLDKSLNLSRKKIHAQTTMVKRELHKMYGLYEERLRSRSDTLMWRILSMVAKVDDKIERLNDAHAYYRKHEASMVVYRKSHPMYDIEVRRIFDEILNEKLAHGIKKNNTKFLK